jgi:5-methylcytosine-specific restriction endonuclease McrA
MAFTDALRGYAHRVLERDNFTCRYCGLDGRIWPNWLYLSWDHLVPISDPLRDDETYIVAAPCRSFTREVGWPTGLEPATFGATRRR